MSTLLVGRCNPYGAETGGPKRVLGGLYGPDSAKTPDAGLPEAVAQGEWACPNRAQVRCRMVCKCGHKGQVMQLCSTHDETVRRGDPDHQGGVITETVRVPGHYEEIQRRQSGLCPRCAYPPEALGLHEAMRWLQTELATAGMLGDNGRVASLRIQLEDAAKSMTLLNERGIVHRCPLTLVEVS